ncbi:unnamed protein product [Microthlaspi erraticum]|uniref:J domain-containing protein n=1 Tax=Microthlaspi erraticum TaxID=1685480 RepID=A0A6D2JDB4_9BRAS|nr:unnamed protein product [Microthlaspi erraticum]
MDESTSPTVFTENQVSLAEEHYQRGNLKGAIEILNALTYGHPNTSNNHRKISQALVAYQIHWRFLGEGFTHYDILRISSPFCSHQMIQKRYRDLLVKLCPDKNKSVAAKSAFGIINTAWKILSDPARRRNYNIEQGFQRRFMYPDDEPDQSPRQGKRHCVQVSDDSDSNSD